MSSFLTRAVLQGFSTGTGNGTILSGGIGTDDFLTNSDLPPGCDWNPLPGALTMERLAIHVSAPAGTNFTFQPFKGIPAVDTGPAVVLGSGNSSDEGAVAVTISSPTVVGDLATQAVGWRGSSDGSGGSILSRTLWSYSVASPYDKYNVLAGGFPAGTTFFENESTRFLGVGTAFTSDTEDDVELVMPVAGTFKYFLAVLLLQNALSDSNYTCSLDVNGTPIITATADNSLITTLTKNVVTTAPVVAGDRVAFRFTTDGTIDNTHRGCVYAAVGFLPS